MDVRSLTSDLSVPPQNAPDFIRVSPLAEAAGWIDLDPGTLCHKHFANDFGLGDAGNTTNAKTAAAARKQAPVVVHKLLLALGRPGKAARGNLTCDGHGSCLPKVERGKRAQDEFSCGGKVAPSLPNWQIDGTRASALAWCPNERVLPPLVWPGMPKGREWLAKPEMVG